MADSPEPSPTATLYDVARLAGVSPSTVSRILNGTVRVSEGRRHAVEQAIAQLRFKPNLSARSLRSGETHTVGVLVKGLDALYFARSVLGIDDGLAGSGYVPVIMLGHGDAAQEIDRLRLLVARGVDAIAVLGSRLGDGELEEFARQVPLAVTGREARSSQLLSFAFDQIEGGCEATRHLIGLGHRQIAHIAGPQSELDARQRREGFLRAHAQAGLPLEMRLIVEGDFLEVGGVAAMNQLLDGGHPFSAVFCANDLTAWGACLALRRRGLRVPQDVSIVGFDDLPLPEFIAQPITSVRQPVYEMSLAVAAALLQALGQPPKTATSFPPLSLVVRSSSAPPR